MEPVAKLIVRDILWKAEGVFNKPLLFTREELVALSQKIVEEYSPYCVLEESSLEADNVFETALKVMLFSSAARIEVSPASFKVEFTRMQFFHTAEIFGTALEFVHEQIPNRQIDRVTLTSYMHADFQSEAEYNEFMNQFRLTSETMDGGFIYNIKGIEGGEVIRISAEKSLGSETGLFIRIETALNRVFVSNDLNLISEKTNGFLVDRGLAIADLSIPREPKE